jgi:PAS domain S-box-containing protein
MNRRRGAGTILNVDDDEAGRYAATRILRQAGYHVLESGSGLEALALVRSAKPDLVLLDVKLPDINGLEVARRIKEDPETAHILVLQLSASFVHARDTVRGLEAGADSYLTEPLEAAVLVATVDALMRIRQAEVALRESEAQYRLLFESNPLPTWVFDSESFRILAVNGAATEHYGYSRDEFLAMTIRDLAPAAGAGGDADPRTASAPAHHRTRDGRDLEVELTRAALTFDGRPAWLVIATDVTHRRRVEQARAELLAREREARAEAEKSARAKDEFLAVVSHELRTPLNAMYGWVRMLSRGQLDAASTQRALEAIERNTTLQAKLIEDLLDVSRIITGKLTLQAELLDLGQAVALATETAQAPALAAGVTVTLEGPRAGLVVEGDRSRLEQIFSNLLSNAVKFTPAGGHVRVRVAQRADWAVITVADSGQGIKAEFMPHLFERFRQADSSSARSYSGLGLGLAIVRHLVELHEGSVTADSPGEGQGATFTVSLPLAVGSRVPEREAVLSHDLGAPGAPLHGMRVLLVEDDADSRSLLSVILEQAGARVTPSASGSEALAALESAPVDALVSDVGMAGMDGYALLREIRKRSPERGGRTPAVALTAYASADDAERAIASGFDRHLPKPVEPAVFIATLGELLRSRR